MSEPLHLQDYTWLTRREHLMHSFENRPIPSLLLGGSINLAAARAAAGAVFVALLVLVPLALLVMPDAWSPGIVLMVLLVVVVPTTGAGMYMTWRRKNVPAWLSAQLDWARQPRRIRTPQPGGPEPDKYTYAAILWRPVDAGWKARETAARSHIARVAARSREG